MWDISTIFYWKKLSGVQHMCFGKLLVKETSKYIQNADASAVILGDIEMYCIVGEKKLTTNFFNAFCGIDGQNQNIIHPVPTGIQYHLSNEQHRLASCVIGHIVPQIGNGVAALMLTLQWYTSWCRISESKTIGVSNLTVCTVLLHAEC